MSAQRWVVVAGHSLVTADGPLATTMSGVDSPIVVILAPDHEAAVVAAEVEVMRLISRAIADGHRGNDSAADDICCQVCQEIECDPDCAVAESRAKETAAWNAAIDLIDQMAIEAALDGRIVNLDELRRPVTP